MFAGLGKWIPMSMCLSCMDAPDAKPQRHRVPDAHQATSCPTTLRSPQVRGKKRDFSCLSRNLQKKVVEQHGILQILDLESVPGYKLLRIRELQRCPLCQVYGAERCGA